MGTENVDKIQRESLERIMCYPSSQNKMVRGSEQGKKRKKEGDKKLRGDKRKRKGGRG